MNDKSDYEAWLEEMVEQLGGVDILPGVSAGGADSERNWWKSFGDVLSTVRVVKWLFRTCANLGEEQLHLLLRLLQLKLSVASSI